MLSKSFRISRALVLVLPFACSESDHDDTGAGGNGGATATGGANASGGSSAIGGTSPAGAAGNSNAASGGSAAGSAGTAGNAASAGTAGVAGDARLFVPEGLPNTELDGDGGLTLVAFTLLQGASGAEFFAAVRNDGSTPACEAGMTIDFYDEAGALVSSTAGTLQTGRLYRLSGDDGVHVWCVPPGDVAMTSGAGLDTVVIENLGRLEHRFPAFAVDVVPVEGLGVTGITAVTNGGRTAYTGSLTNGLDAPVTNPKVSIFPLNGVGRPLGVATSTETTEVPAAGSWPFETSTVVDAGVDFAAYPNATLPQ
jgi:hypothetical protein